MPRSLSSLPIDSVVAELCSSLAKIPTAVVEAEPGAGKTTRIPRALFDAGFARHGEIVITQPRRIAARLAAEAEEGDIILLLGAGNINKISPNIIESLRLRAEC